MASRALRRRSTYRALNGHNRDRPKPLLRFILVSFILLLMLTSGASAATILLSGSSLPSLSDFTKRFQFQNTILYANDGRTAIANLADMTHGKRVVEPLKWPGSTTTYYKQQGETWLVGDGQHDYGIPTVLQDATIATEDATFYSNPGFDPLSIIRAGYDDLTQGRVVSGASTITQQLIKQYLLAPSPTLSRKFTEIVLAAELTQKYPKSKILWYYLNSIPYGNLSIGAQAAARTYFNENVWRLDLAQAAMLAGLPEAPSVYNPITNFPATLRRMETVLYRMTEHGYITASQENQALTEAQSKGFIHFVPPQSYERYPHFVQYAIDQLDTIMKGAGALYHGLRVVTSLNPALQDAAQKVVTNQINAISGQNVTDGALVSMDIRAHPGPNDCYGCVLAMVGSADYNNKAIAGQINMADTPRQPGSSFKPFNYEYAFENGLSPATTVLDGPLTIDDPGTGLYQPTDYDQKWHGVVTLRVALQNSLNVPAVRVEQYGAQKAGSVRASVGNNAVKLGISSLYADNPTCCGYALTLGGLQGGVRLVEETSAYGTFGTLGKRVKPIAILKIIDSSTGRVLYDARPDMQQEEQSQVIQPQYAYEMTNVLSDDASRCTVQVCEFGTGSDLYLGRPAAAKTGTTNSYTDNWTVGYTPQIVTGVWVGNTNDTQMINSTGITGAAPIWNQYMNDAINIMQLPPDDWKQPAGVYYGSECQQPNGYGGTSIGSFSYDIYAGSLPLCSVGSQTYLQPEVPSQATTPSAQAPTAAPAPTSQVVTVPTSPVQRVQPTAVPQTAPTQSIVQPLPSAPVGNGNGQGNGNGHGNGNGNGNGAGNGTGQAPP